jgi:hypothetical protein
MCDRVRDQGLDESGTTVKLTKFNLHKLRTGPSPSLFRSTLLAGSMLGLVVTSVSLVFASPTSAKTSPTACRPEREPTEVSKAFGPLTGSSHFGVVGNTWRYSIATPEAFGKRSKWGGNKLLMAVHRSAGPSVTVTGHLLGDPKVQLRFGSQSLPARSRVLRLSDSKELDGGWYGFPNMIRAQKPGCYRLRFKSTRFDETLTLRIVPSVTAVNQPTSVLASSPPTCDARPIVTELAQAVGQSVTVSHFFSAADFAWMSDQGSNPKRIGNDASSHATLTLYFSRLAAASDRWSINTFVGQSTESGVTDFYGGLSRGRLSNDKTTFKGAVRCSTGKIIALSIGSLTP